MPITYVSGFPVDDVVLSRLHARAFGRPETVSGWRRRLDRHALTWVGAFDDDGGHLVGFVQVAWDGGGHAFLLDTAVDPDHRRRGIGAGLVAAAVRDVAAAGCEWLHVDFEPHLTGFYLDRCGFAGSPAGVLRVSAGATGAADG